MLISLFWSSLALGAGWVTPTGNVDGTGWSNGNLARDGSTSSYASHAPVLAWGAWETFSLGVSIWSDRFRVNTDFGYDEVDQIQVDISPDNVIWTTAYIGAVADGTWDTRAFTAQNVQFARFRYHRIATIYTFWLFEFNFYEAPPVIVAPTVDTTAATSIEENTGILHGSITASGGNPCEVWFEWGTTGGAPYANSTTPHQFNVVTGGTFGKLITNAVAGTVYYRAVALNSAGTGYGPERSFTHGPPVTGWISPSGNSDPDSAWLNEDSAYEDELTTYARSLHDIGDPDGLWSPYLILTHATMNCNGLRFYAKDDANIDSAELDVFNGTTWTNVFFGVFTDKTWTEAWFTRQTVTQARIRFHVAANNVGLYWELYEFDFHRVMQVTISGTRDNSAVPVSLLVRGVASGTDSSISGTYSITAWMGAEDPLLIYDDNNAVGNDAAIVTLASTSASMTSLNLTASTLILRNDFGSIVTNTDIRTARGASADTDIPYTWSGSDITVSSGITLTIASGKTYMPGGNLTLSANFTNNGVFTAETGTVTFNGNTTLSGSGGFTFNHVTISGTLMPGARTITVSGNWTNNGTFTATGSTVTFNGATAVAISGTGNFNNLIINKSAATTTVTPASALSVSGALTVTLGTLALSTFSHTAGAVTLSSGSITSTTGTLTGSSYSVQSGTVSAILGGAGRALTKTTTGTVTLSGANTYTGGTTVTAGTLLVNGSLAAGAGATTVADGATLGGTGTVRAISVASNGTVSPGNPIVSGGIGTLTAASANFSAGGTLLLQVNSLASFDRLAMTGALTLDGGSILKLASVPTVSGTITSVITFGSLQPTTSAKFAFVDNPSITMGVTLNYNGGAGPINLTFSASGILSIAWAAGTTDSNGAKSEGNITAANWILGSVNLAAIRTTHSAGSDPAINFVIRNTGGVNESFTVTCVNPAAWTLASAVGANQFEMGVNTDDSAVYYSLIGGRVIRVGARLNATQSFDLRFAAPTSTSTGATQSIKVIVTASAP
ncbi:MAG: autotransporter-associated beta strand repeat-containing protein [Planctomycetota bacterium]